MRRDQEADRVGLRSRAGGGFEGADWPISLTHLLTASRVSSTEAQPVPTANDSREFERFVTAVHRRMAVLRAVERVGLCVLGGCVVAAALSPILMTRGEPTDNLILAALGAAIVGGLFWGLLSRPSRLAAAAEVDRQLRLADLLGTAVMLRAKDADDAMAGAVLALADAQCRATTPATVVLHRFGARGWGGIGLALAFVVGLNLLGPDATHSANRDTARAASWGDVEAAQADEGGRSAGNAAAPDLRRARTGNGSDEAQSPPSETTEDRPAASAQASGSVDQGTGGGSQDGTGAGAGKSNSRKPGDGAIKAEPGEAHDSATNGAVAAGGGTGTATGSARPGDQAGSTAGQGSGAARRPAPVWDSKGWGDDRGAAEAAVRNGRVSDAYRELVRGYFQAD